MRKRPSGATPVSGVVQTDAYTRLDAILAHTEQKMTTIRAFLAQGPLDLPEWEQVMDQYQAVREVRDQALRDREFLQVMWGD